MSDHDTSTTTMERVAARLPPGTWDTHMHVVEPQRWPLSTAAAYQPSPHTLDDARAMLTERLGIAKMVVVQPSIYGVDNGCTLAGLDGLGLAHGRAVVQFDPATTTAAQLREWHARGVRGVRINFKSVGGRITPEWLTDTLQRYADAVAPLGWVIQLYVAMDELPLLEPAVSAMGSRVKICIDHVGHPSAAALAAARSAHDLPGFDAFARLLQLGNTWTKISATYRLHSDPRHPVVESLCREVLRRRPDRCVFATDWPHTRFEGVPVADYLEAVLDWIEAEGVPLQQVCVDNAAVLFDAQS